MSFSIRYKENLGRHGVIGSLRFANFNSTADQIVPVYSFINSRDAVPKFSVSQIIVTNCSTSLTTAVGGFYLAASKGGTNIVANTQAYSSLTTANSLLSLTLTTAAITTLFTTSMLYFSLTTAQGAAATADIYIIGIDLQ